MVRDLDALALKAGGAARANGRGAREAACCKRDRPTARRWVALFSNGPDSAPAIGPQSGSDTQIESRRPCAAAALPARVLRAQDTEANLPSGEHKGCPDHVPRPLDLSAPHAGGAGCPGRGPLRREERARRLADLIDKSEARRGDGTSLGPTMVRLAWHSAGTFCARTGTGGSDGGRMKYCPESAWGANAGLADVRAVVEKVAHCVAQPDLIAAHGLSRADAYTLAGVVAVAHMGGPEVPWAAGRSDAADGSTSPPDGRLPDADKGSLGGTVAHLRAIFYRMGFDDRDIVALSGAHALGRCHEEASGYWGPWTFAETTFSTSTSAFCWRRPGR